MIAITFISAMCTIVLTWGLLFGIFVGVGLFIQRLLGLRKFDADHCLMNFWMGFAGTILFLQLWHLKMPIGVLAFVVVSVVGFIGLIWNGRCILIWLKANLPGKYGFFLAMLILTIWLANRSTEGCVSDDSGLYHLTGVRWNSAYPIVVGLGNLHIGLALNNANFLYAALLEIGPWYGRSNHLANSLLLTVLGAQCILGGYRLAQPGARKTAVSLFNLFLLTPLVLTAVHSWLSSYNPDMVVAVLAFVGSVQIFAFVLKDETNLKEQAYDVIFITVILAVGICTKLSMVFFSFLNTLVVVSVWLYRARKQRQLAIATMFKTIVMAFLLLVPWAVRGVVLSGYPLYPSTLLAMPVRWRIPETLLKWHVNGIKFHSYRTWDTSGFQWLSNWVYDLERDILLPFFVIILGVLVILWLVWKRYSSRSNTTSVGWLMLLPTLVAIVFWFFTAPSRRFGYFLFWILAGSFLCMLFHRYAPVERKKFRTMVIVICLVFTAVNIKKFFILPPPGGGMHATPKVAAETVTTVSGLELYVPAEGFGCWDMQLPCTPYPQKNLRLRRKGDLASGFVLDGPVIIPSSESVDANRL